MTKEEAIEYGKEQLNIFGGKHREFIEMAIKALDSIDEIRTEIEQIELLARYTRGDIKQMALEIIDKYRAESEVEK